jgi:hypothetical protein
MGSPEKQNALIRSRALGEKRVFSQNLLSLLIFLIKIAQNLLNFNNVLE